MNRKCLTLTADDRRAIDLLLDHGLAQSPVTRVTTGVAQPRVAAASRVLGRLDAMPDIAVPADLVSRTLQRIASEPSRPAAEALVTAAVPMH